MRFGPMAALVGCSFDFTLESTCLWPQTAQVYLFLAVDPPQKNESNAVLRADLDLGMNSLEQIETREAEMQYIYIYVLVGYPE